MLSILVCHSYFLRLDQKQAARAKPYPPLATLQVVALLREAGHQVTFFDSMLAEGIGDYQCMLDAGRPQLVVFYEDNFNFLSKMCLAAMREAACEMIGAARRFGCRVIAAGPDISDAPTPYLKAGADLALAGEGISTLLALLPRLDSDRTVQNVEWIGALPGVRTMLDGRLFNGPGIPTAELVAESGVAAWDLVDIERYRAAWKKAHGHFSLNLAASRGCPFRCTWCAKPTWGNHYLQRSAQDVADEMALVKHRFSPDHIWFADDIFGFRVQWVQEFARALKTQDAQIPFTIQTRADLVSDGMARALQAAGCQEAWIGAESGSQRVLDAMNKGTTIEHILLARERLKAVGIRVGFFIQLGYLGEQLEDIEATRALLLRAQPDDIGVSVSYPLPGTKFYELVKAQLHGKTHWQESNDLAMLFQGTFVSDFYRALRDLLHKQIALQKETVSESIERRRASQALESRWRELLADAVQYRSSREPSVARA